MSYSATSNNRDTQSRNGDSQEPKLQDLKTKAANHYYRHNNNNSINNSSNSNDNRHIT